MRKAARKLLWAAAGLLALAFLIAPLVLNSRGPSYRGRTLTAWTTEFDGIGGPKRDEAEVAVRSIGTNGLSCIRSMLRAKDTPLKVQANALLSRQSWIKFRFVSAQVLRQRGLRACRALGTNARPAIPDITALVYDPQLSRDAATVLTQFGSEVIPILTNAAAHPDPRIRYGAIAPIAILDDQSTVPTLLRCLKDPDDNVRAFATEALGIVAKDPEAAIPALLESLQDTNSFVRSAAAYRLNLWTRYPQAKAAVPLLIKAFRETAQSPPSDPGNYSLHRNAEAILKKLDPQAATASPAPQE